MPNCAVALEVGLESLERITEEARDPFALPFGRFLFLVRAERIIARKLGMDV